MRLLIFMFLALVLFSSVSMADECNKIPYDELKNMDKECLQRIICDYKRIADYKMTVAKQNLTQTHLDEATKCGVRMLDMRKTYKMLFGEYPTECVENTKKEESE